jgi:hypothetical protein
VKDLRMQYESPDLAEMIELHLFLLLLPQRRSFQIICAYLPVRQSIWTKQFKNKEPKEPRHHAPNRPHQPQPKRSHSRIPAAATASQALLL